MTVVARALRLDGSTWRRVSAMATPAGAGLMVLGAFLVLAFDRFGVQGILEPRATVRMGLTGFYGWMWLSGAIWLSARLAFGHRGPLRPLVPLVGHAHLPLLLVAVFIQFVSVTLDLTGPAWWFAVFVGLFWMPGMLVAAVRNLVSATLLRAVAITLIPYVVWVLVVGRTLWTQVGHLL